MEVSCPRLVSGVISVFFLTGPSFVGCLLVFLHYVFQIALSGEKQSICCWFIHVKKDFYSVSAHEPALSPHVHVFLVLFCVPSVFSAAAALLLRAELMFDSMSDGEVTAFLLSILKHFSEIRGICLLTKELAGTHKIHK